MIPTGGLDSPLDIGDDTRLLAPLGLSVAAERLYGLLAGRHDWGECDVLDHPDEMAELVEVGLVSRVADRFRIVPVRLAVERWVVEQESRIRVARFAAQQYAAIQRTGSGGFLEMIRGVDQVQAAYLHIQETATEALLCFDREPYFSTDTHRISPVQESVSGSGVEYRVVYQQKALEDEVILESVRQSIELGEKARTFGAVPFRMIIADRSCALLILPHSSGTDELRMEDVDALMVYPSSMLDALVRTFTMVWGMALPFGDDADMEDSILEHRTLLRLLSSGLTDSSIARQLSVSERTVHRRIRRLEELLGASNRFVLGVQAVKQGWI